MTEILDESLKVWSQSRGLTGMCVSPVSFERATKAVISEVKPMRADDLESWLLYDSHRADFADWLPYFTRFPGHEIRAYFVNVNPQSESYNNYLVMRCQGEIVFIDEWNETGLVAAEVFDESEN